MKLMTAAAVRAEGPCYLLDVRTPREHASAHLAGSELMPLDALDVEAVKRAAAGKRCVVVCQSGMRAQHAAERLEAAGVEAVVLDGGVNAWEAAGLPLVKGQGGGLPLQRQVFLVIGLMAATGSLLALLVDPRWAGLSLFAGCGLILAGATGFCPLALLMAKMPWNQAPKPAGRASCASGSCCQ